MINLTLPMIKEDADELERDLEIERETKEAIKANEAIRKSPGKHNNPKCTKECDNYALRCGCKCHIRWGEK